VTFVNIRVAFGWRVCVALLFLGLRGGPDLNGQGTSLASVTFHVVTPLGKILDYRVRRFEAVNSKNSDLSAHFSGLSGKDLPYSDYSYALVPTREEQRSYGQITGRLVLYQQSLFKTISVWDLVGIDSEFAPIQGRLDPIPANPAGVWVRMQSIFDHTYEESAVDSAGKFIFHIPARGRFLLIACTDRGVIGTKALNLPGGGPADIVVNILSRVQ
jgi:hypothetical protein